MHVAPSFVESSPTEKHVRNLQLWGLEVLETEFHWTSGQRLGSDYQAFELHCRLQPYNVFATAWQDGATESVIGRLSLLIPGKRYHARAAAKDETVRTVICRFDAGWITRVAGKNLAWDELDPRSLLDIQHPHIERSMRRIADEISRPQFGSERLIEALSTAIAVDLVRYFETESAGCSVDTQKLSPRRLDRIRELVRLMDRAVTPDDIAVDLGMSVTYLRRVFRNTTGQTLNDFLEQSRIAKACALLTETEIPVKVISFLIGFAQHSTFSYAFKRKTGLTPSEYRARKLI